MILIPIWLLVGQPLLKLANAYFMLGLVILALALMMILSHAHLFAGWPKLFRGLMGRQRAVDEQDIEKKERVDRRHVASEQKNGPIVVSQLTQTFLWIAGLLLVLGIVLTL